MIGSTTYLQTLLHSIHHKVSQNPFDIETQCIACTNPARILGTLLQTGAPSDVILSIARTILERHHSTQSHIFGLRATMVYPLGEFDYCWMVLEWRENIDTDVLAIYLIDEDNEPGVYNWLMHTSQSQDTTSISWTIRHIDYLQRLFEGVHHILGVLELSVADAVRLCSRNSTDTSNNAYVSHQCNANSGYQGIFNLLTGISGNLNTVLHSSIKCVQIWNGSVPVRVWNILFLIYL
jgi:hypothetical protein